MGTEKQKRVRPTVAEMNELKKQVAELGQELYCQRWNYGSLERELYRMKKAKSEVIEAQTKRILELESEKADIYQKFNELYFANELRSIRLTKKEDGDA